MERAEPGWFVYTEQLPPHDDHAEESVLGSLLIDGEAVTGVQGILEPVDFFRQRHAWIYDACVSLFTRNDPISQVSVADELSRQHRLDEVGGLPFLSHLIAVVPTSVYADNYARVVRRLSIHRQLITAGAQIADIGARAGDDEEESLRKAEELLYRMRLGRTTRDLESLHDVLDRYVEESGQVTAGHIGGVESGFADLDRQLGGGFQPSDLLILAARPGVGKSAFALNVAKSAAATLRADGRRRTVAFFSLEMASEQVAERLLAGESGVNSTRIRTRIWTDYEEGAIMNAVGRLADLPLYIDDSVTLGIVELRSKARRLHLDEGLDLIVVDYLQLMTGANFAGNRVQEISEISRFLKALARDLNVPVLALSQLSRAVESRPRHEPLLSDLRESGAIEQDADVVLFLYRADMVYTGEEWERQHPDQEYPRGIADVIIAKHRNGPTGRMQVVFEERTTTFRNAARAGGGAAPDGYY